MCWLPVTLKGWMVQTWSARFLLDRLQGKRALFAPAFDPTGAGRCRCAQWSRAAPPFRE